MNIFYKESESKIITCFFFLFFCRGGGGGEEEGMATVSECFTMDPNKKKMFFFVFLGG